MSPGLVMNVQGDVSTEVEVSMTFQLHGTDSVQCNAFPPIQVYLTRTNQSGWPLDGTATMVLMLLHAIEGVGKCYIGPITIGLS